MLLPLTAPVCPFLNHGTIDQNMIYWTIQKMVYITFSVETRCNEAEKLVGQE